MVTSVDRGATLPTMSTRNTLPYGGRCSTTSNLVLTYLIMEEGRQTNSDNNNNSTLRTLSFVVRRRQAKNNPVLRIQMRLSVEGERQMTIRFA